MPALPALVLRSCSTPDNLKGSELIAGKQADAAKNMAGFFSLIAKKLDQVEFLFCWQADADNKKKRRLRKKSIFVNRRL